MTDPASRYAESGVHYGPLDAFKRLCQRAAAPTASALAAHGYGEPIKIRGESAYLIESSSGYLAHVEEGLGTKNLVADEMIRLAGGPGYFSIGIDTVATIVNDMITVGALPISVAMHAAVGSTDWFSNESRTHDLAEGFAEGCRRAGAVWGGGETPVLAGIVGPTAIVLAGSALGQIADKRMRIAGDVRAGDQIVLLDSSGVHTNGLTLCRRLAESLPDGYRTPIADGRSYGEALLDPSIIYVPWIAACQREQLPLHYAVHITGHGWRKLMRLDEPFIYRVIDPPKPPPIFDFLCQQAGLSMSEAYATFNMGAGFAAFVPPAAANRCVELARSLGFSARIAGTILKEGSRKAVEIPSLDVVFEADTLDLRG